MNITFKDIPTIMQFEAINAANTFSAEFPEHMGVRNGVGFSYKRHPNPMYVYRTKAGNIVVRMA